MRIQFITQVLLFIEYAKHNKLAASVRMLWLGIFLSANYLAQKTGKANIWPTDFFPVSNDEMKLYTGLDVRTIRKNQKELKAYGLIDYVKGDGTKADPFYKIYYLQRIGYKVVPNHDSDSNSDMVSNYTFTDACGNVNSKPRTKDKNVVDNERNSRQKASNVTSYNAPDSDVYAETHSNSATDTNNFLVSQGLVDLTKPIGIGLVPTSTLNRRN